MSLLKAVMDPSGFASGAAKVQGAAKKTGASLRGMGGSAQKANRVAGQLKSTIMGLAGGFTALMVIRSAIKNITQFESSMVKVRNVTGATEAQFKKLSGIARQMGATTIFSASQAADALLFLGRAGFSVSESIASVGAVMDLAATSGMSLGEAADVSSNVLRQFGLKAEDMTRVVDAMTNAANNSNTSVKQLGEALVYAGPVAKMSGRSLEETAAAIGVLGDAGIQGSMAGTNLRGVMLALANPTEDAREALKKMHLEIKDVSPAANDLATISERLNKGLTSIEDPTKRLAAAGSIFGRRNVSAAGIMATSFQRQRDLQKIMEQGAGATNEQAAAQMNTIAGKAKLVSSAFAELTLQAGDGGVTRALKKVLGVTSELFQDLGGLNDNASTTVKVIESLAAAASTLVAIRLATWIGSATLAMAGLAATTATGGVFGILVAGAAAAAATFALLHREAHGAAKEIGKLLESTERDAFARLFRDTSPATVIGKFPSPEELGSDAQEKIQSMRSLLEDTLYNEGKSTLSPSDVRSIVGKIQETFLYLENDGSKAALQAAEKIKTTFFDHLLDLPTSNTDLKIDLVEKFNKALGTIARDKMFDKLGPEYGGPAPTAPPGGDTEALKVIQQMQASVEQETRLASKSDEQRQVAIATTQFQALAEQAYGGDVEKTHAATMAYMNALKQLNEARQKAIGIQQESADAEMREANARQSSIQQIQQETNAINQLQTQGTRDASAGDQSILNQQANTGAQLGAAIAQSFVSNITSGKADFSGLANAVMDQMVTGPMSDMLSSTLNGILGPLQNPAEMTISAGTVYVNGAVSGGGMGGGGDLGVGGLEGFGGFTGDPGGGGFFAKGGIFDFAGGGIFDREQRFSFGNSKRGRLAERGPEALMPVRQMPGGDLGVQATVGGGTHGESGDRRTVNVDLHQHISTPDARSFRKARVHIKQDQESVFRRML